MRPRAAAILVAIAATSFASSAVHAEDGCAAARGSYAESALCSEPGLKTLDQSLNAAYGLAREAAGDKNALRTSQLQWLRSVRDKCDSADCLRQVYQARIAALAELFAATVRPLEQALSDTEARAACRALANVADNEGLSRLAIPGVNSWWAGEQGREAGWAVSQEEEDALKSEHDFFFTGIDTVYKLRLAARRKPVRFASFSTGGTCASTQTLSLPLLLQSKGSDIPVDAVGGTEDAYWGSGDYPVFYRGRYFMITADLADRNRVSMISWIKPDGKQRPLCLLSPGEAQPVVVSASNPQLCAGIAEGTLHPLEWKPVQEALPFNHDPAVYRNEFEKRYGNYADTVDLLAIDLDGDGKTENIAKFQYDSGAGCGSTHIWLSTLSGDLGQRVDGPLDRQLAVSGAMDVYEAGGRYYVAGQGGSRTSSVFQFRGGKAEQVCELRRKPRNEVKQFFDAGPEVR